MQGAELKDAEFGVGVNKRLDALDRLLEPIVPEVSIQYASFHITRLANSSFYLTRLARFLLFN